MSADCLFCKIVAGQIPATVVHEGARTLAFRDIHPQASTHVLVVPREHHEDALSVATDAPGLLDEMVTAAGEVARLEGIEESGYRLVFNTGDDALRAVWHAHLHVLGGDRLGLFGKP